MSFTVRHPRIEGVTAVVEDLDRAKAAGWVVDEPEPEPVSEPEVVELDELEEQPEPEPKPAPKRRRNKGW